MTVVEHLCYLLPLPFFLLTDIFKVLSAIVSEHFKMKFQTKYLKGLFTVEPIKIIMYGHRKNPTTDHLVHSTKHFPANKQ